MQLRTYFDVLPTTPNSED